MSRGLRHLALKTRDLARTEAFYRDVIGLRRAFDHAGMLFLETPGGGDLLNFVRTRGPVARGGLDHFGLSFTRAEWKKAVARVKDAGVKITGRRGASAIYIEDPNGYTVELYCD
jgi:catechol 2,3-dioxygenase-like lactoylglutathione lyase family enzyme